jgi:hypothetical protein
MNLRNLCNPCLFFNLVYSTLVVMRHSAKQATVVGEVVFTDAHRLAVNERIDFADGFVMLSIGSVASRINKTVYNL